MHTSTAQQSLWVNCCSPSYPKDPTRKQRESTAFLQLIWVVCAVALFLQGPSYAEVKPIRRVLVLNELGTSYPGINLVDQGLRAAFDSSPYKLEVYREYMETNAFPDPADQQRFRDFYLAKYRNHQPDVIITVGPSPLNFMVDTHRKAFPGIPIIFCLPRWSLGSPELDSDFTGVENSSAPLETILAALRLQPRTKHIVVVAGMSAVDNMLLITAKEQLKSLEGTFDVLYLTNLAMNDLLEQLRHLPDHSVVLFLSLGKDAEGTTFKSGSESGPMVVAAANAPVFSLTDVSINHGEVGGKLFYLVEQGKIAGEMAVRMLNGDKPRDVPRVKGRTVYMFDRRALKRWGFSEKNLPLGSIILNKSPSFWELYKWYVLAAILMLLAQAAAILGLLRQRARRRTTEAELRQSEEKFSKSFRHSPLVITITRMRDARYLEVNEAFEQQTGWKREEVIGRTHFDIRLWENPEARTAIIAQLLARGTVRDVEFKVRRKDGQILTALGSAEVIEVNGEPCMLGVATNISDRKAAEEALAGVSRKLVEAQEAERTRIARELHDDVNQRLAMLAVNLKLLRKELPSSEVKTRQHIEEACAKVTDLENDIQALSHRLHSSGLEYLGLEAAVSGFCRELSEQQNLEIHVRLDGVPEMLPHEVSLCLFRVLQEAVHNAIKYSGVREFDVSLSGVSNEIQLSVHDSGVGFDLSDANAGSGLGLTSMRERLRLVNGQLSIESNPQHGTTVLARVPLDASLSPEPGITSADAVA
jgi:PAS domain S-box-containing protein